MFRYWRKYGIKLYHQWISNPLGHSMSNHQIIQENLTCPHRNGWNLVCTTSYIYQILLYLGTSMAWDIAHWRLLIQSYFLPTWRLATSLDLSDTRIRISSDSRGSSELKTYIWIDFGMENLKITLRICGNVTFKSYEVDCVYVVLSLKC